MLMLIYISACLCSCEHEHKHADAFSHLRLHVRYCKQTEVGTRNFFGVRNRNSATLRRHFRNRIPQLFSELLLRNRNSAMPQSQFFLKSATLSSQPETFTSAIFGRFLAWSSLKLYIFYRQVFFAIERILKRHSTRFSASVYTLCKNYSTQG